MTVTAVDYGVDEVNASTYTFSGLGIGAADGDRWVVAAIYVSFSTGRSLATVTIGGVSATRMGAEPTLAAEGVRIEFWKAAVPTGTTADVVITTVANDMYAAACATYNCSDEPTLNDIDVDTSAATSGGNFVLNNSVDVNAGGTIVAMGGIGFTGALVSWTGVSNVYEDTASHIFNGASDGLSVETGRAVDLLVDDTYGINEILVAMSFDVASGSSTDALLADDVESDSEVSAPSIGQEHALTSTDVESASEVTSPAIGQEHSLTATGVESATEVSSPALSVIAPNVLLADDVESATEVSAPTIGQVHSLTGSGVESASGVSEPAVGQTHAITASSVESSSEVSVPALGSSGADNLLADDLESAAEVSLPTVGQTHALTAISVESASETAAPLIGQGHALLAADAESASEVSSPALADGLPGLTADNVESLSEVSSPALGQTHALNANDVQSSSVVSIASLNGATGRRPGGGMPTERKRKTAKEAIREGFKAEVFNSVKDALTAIEAAESKPTKKAKRQAAAKIRKVAAFDPYQIKAVSGVEAPKTTTSAMSSISDAKSELAALMIGLRKRQNDDAIVALLLVA